MVLTLPAVKLQVLCPHNPCSWATGRGGGGGRYRLILTVSGRKHGVVVGLLVSLAPKGIKVGRGLAKASVQDRCFLVYRHLGSPHYRFHLALPGPLFFARCANCRKPKPVPLVQRPVELVVPLDFHFHATLAKVHTSAPTFSPLCPTSPPPRPRG